MFGRCAKGCWVIGRVQFYLVGLESHWAPAACATCPLLPKRAP